MNMFTQYQLKQMVADAARDEVLKNMAPGVVLGIGTGSTANLFIDAIAPHQNHFAGVVSSSQASTDRLKKHGFVVWIVILSLVCRCMWMALMRLIQRVIC